MIAPEYNRAGVEKLNSFKQDYHHIQAKAITATIHKCRYATSLKHTNPEQQTIEKNVVQERLSNTEISDACNDCQWSTITIR